MWYNPWAAPIFPAPQPQTPGYPWWVSPPIVVPASDTAAQAQPPLATQPLLLPPGNPWGNAPPIFPPASDTVAQAQPPLVTQPLLLPPGNPWGNAPPIFPPANDKTAQAQPPLATQPLLLPPGNPWGNAPPIFPPASDTTAQAQGPEANDPRPGSMVNDIVRSTATGVPVVGGLLDRMNAATNAALAPLLNPLFDQRDQLTEPTFGGRYAHALRDQEGADKRFSSEHPRLDTAARLTGGIAAMAPAVAAAPWAYGVGGTLPPA
jgi:hypothetical protein